MTADLTSVTRFIPGEVVDYLHRHHVITLSTSSFTGMPHADTVVYVNDSRTICFFVGEGTQMLRNIKDSRHVSFTIDDYTVDWRKVRELQGWAAVVRPRRSRMRAPGHSTCRSSARDPLGRPGSCTRSRRARCTSSTTTTQW